MSNTYEIGQVDLVKDLVRKGFLSDAVGEANTPAVEGVVETPDQRYWQGQYDVLAKLRDSNNIAPHEYDGLVIELNTKAAPFQFGNVERYEEEEEYYDDYGYGGSYY
jgi:hypothetical protein